jgi:hypothetical protein
VQSFVGIAADLIEPGDPLDIDQNRGHQSSLFHLDEQIGPTRNHLGILAMLGKQRTGLLDAAGKKHFEFRQS